MMALKMLRVCRGSILSGCKTCTVRIGREELANGLKYFSTRINEGEPDTICEIVKYWSNRFENEGISEPVESIEHILTHVLGSKKRYSSNTVIQTMDLADAPEQRLSLDQITKLQSLCQCRMSRMPVQYIIGEWDFRDITLKLVPPVFIPRPETEILVDIALRRMAEAKNSHYIVLDIGCGSGAISLALVHSSNQIATSQIQCTSVDKSLYACELTRQNAEILGIQDKLRIVNAALRENGTIKSLNDSHAGVDFDKQQFDIIISNPPYIPTEKLMELAPEIKIYEDLRALDGGKDGLSLIKAVLRYASKALIPRGLLFMEVDPTHPEYIEFFTKKYTDLKLKFEHTYKDYCNNDRFVELSKLD